LEHYEGFKAHLVSRYPLAAHDDACLIFDLREAHA
jgi:hypothetical protein